MRKFVLPVVVGFALLCLLQPIEHWLLSSAHVGSHVYDAIIWGLLVMSLALTAYLVVAACGLAGRAAVIVVALSTVVSVFLILCTLEALAAITWSLSAWWLAREPAMLVGLLLFAGMTTGVTHGFVWLSRRITRAKAGIEVS